MAKQNASRDSNNIPALLGESTTTAGETARAKVNPTTGAVLVEGVSGGTALPVNESSPGAIGDGRKVVTTAGTAVALATATAAKSVTITAETDNTGIISVGGSGVIASLATRRGTPLNAGDSMSLDISDLAVVYIDSTVNGDGVTYTYVQ